MGLIVLAVIWEMAGWIIAGSDQTLLMFGLSLVACATVVYMLNDWRSGVLIFLVWLLFEYSLQTRQSLRESDLQ